MTPDAIRTRETALQRAWEGCRSGRLELVGRGRPIDHGVVLVSLELAALRCLRFELLLVFGVRIANLKCGPFFTNRLSIEVLNDLIACCRCFETNSTNITL